MAAGDLLTTNGHLEWRGILLGPGTTLRTVDFEGLHDLPGVRSGGATIEGFHGAFPTLALLDRRYITWNFQIAQVPIATAAAAVAELQRITTLPEPGPAAPEEPLAIQIDGLKVLVNAQVIRRVVPTDRNYALGYVRGAVQWLCADPRVLLLPQRTAFTGLPVAGSGGLVFPLVFPLDFGAGPTGGVITAANPGRSDAWPLFTLTGPMTGPVITDLDRGYKLSFDPAWTLPAGQSIEIDTRPGYRTVLFTPSGVSAADRLFVRQWFAVPAGSSGLRIALSAGSYHVDARLDAEWYATAQ